MAGKFKKGDVVVLKSGGPEMTITGGGSRGYDNSVTWFDGGKQQYGEFDDEVLELSDDGSGEFPIG